MDKIRCNAQACMHQAAGSCDAGVVRIEEQISAGVPYCATFSLGGDSANTMRNFFRQGFWREDPVGAGGSLCCAMLRCRHNEQGFCGAPAVDMHTSRPEEGRFALCASFEKRE